MLAITFSINPLQAKLERWYLSLSFVLGFGVPLVPAILGHFGKDPMYGLCYFTQGKSPDWYKVCECELIGPGNRELRIRDFVVDLVSRLSSNPLTGQYLWQLLSCLVAAVSVITVSTYPASTHPPSDPSGTYHPPSSIPSDRTRPIPRKYSNHHSIRTRRYH